MAPSRKCMRSKRYVHFDAQLARCRQQLTECECRRVLFGYVLHYMFCTDSTKEKFNSCMCSAKKSIREITVL